MTRQIIVFKKKPIELNSTSFACLYYQGHPLKRIEKANEKGQLTYVKEIRKEGLLEKTYFYGELNLLDKISVKADKKLTWTYVYFYEFHE